MVLKRTAGPFVLMPFDTLPGRTITQLTPAAEDGHVTSITGLASAREPHCNDDPDQDPRGAAAAALTTSQARGASHELR